LKRISMKGLIGAVFFTLLTIAYYVWVIPNWMTKYPKEETTADAESTRLRGDIPPASAFFIHQPRGECSSTLKVKTSSGSSYVIKLIDVHSGQEVLSYYFPGGGSRDIEVPTGTYEIRYTSGKEWFGNEEMFGDSGYYAKAQGRFQFTRGAGYELTLYLVSHGNLRTKVIKQEDF